MMEREGQHLSDDPPERMSNRSSFARHGWIGLALIAVTWPLNWGVLVEGLRTHIVFFPLWLGYALTIDAVVARRRGSSILTRSPTDFAGLFLASIPAWWLFEAINEHTQNWTYVGVEHFSNLEYGILATIAFSTVIPAVFGTAELVRSFDWIDRFDNGPRLRPTQGLLWSFVGIGIAMLGLLLVWPTYFYPFIWGWIFFLTVPLNHALGRPTLLDYTASGDWRPVVSLALGTLVCGFMWEMWNAHASPYWTYDAPGVNFWHVFEMPLIGFIGYLPFGLELHALVHLVFPHRPRLRL